MPYPSDTPSAKHDCLALSEEDLTVSDVSALCDLLDAPIDPKALTHKATVYSYPDGPRHPGPISRSLTVIGLLDTGNAVAQKLMEPGGSMHKCTLGVKRLLPTLPDKDKINCTNFARFITKLRRSDAIAVLSKDKYGRFGILAPMDDDEKFAADCFVGDMDSARKMFQNNSNNNSESAFNAEPADSGLWQPPGVGGGDDAADGLWQPPQAEEETGGGSDGGGGGLWMPPGDDGQTDTMDFGITDKGNDDDNTWNPTTTTAPMEESQSTTSADRKRNADDMDTGSTFHKDAGAATADKFYSGLTRTLDTRSESRLYHMRSFNGWVKATQIQELNPQTQQGGRKKKGNSNAPLRVLDLACGKGGDLGKWILHNRKMSNYVGVDVARGSLKDAAIRARALRQKMERCTFICADLGADVPGRLKSPKRKHMQPLLAWSLLNETPGETGPPDFQNVRGGGVSLSDKFDVVSIQFAIHYMMQTRKRARRFFRTVSELLEIGGNLVATTIDARVVMEHLMDLGEDLHFDSEAELNGENEGKEIVVAVGAGACRIRFQRDVVKKIFNSMATKDEEGFNEDVFGLEYTFTLVEGSDHASGVGEAVDLPEWLTPIPVLRSLAAEAGLEMDYGLNFHEFFQTRKDPAAFPAAHLALYNMKVLNKDGSISSDEWEISRLYCAIKFTKVGEARSVLDDDSDEDDDDGDNNEEEEGNEAQNEKANQKFYIKAMMKAKMSVGKAQWEELSGDEKKRLTTIELKKLVS